VILRVNPEVAKTLKSIQNRYLEELESILRHPVLVKADPLLQHKNSTWHSIRFRATTVRE
jgi:hypothetical protein